MHSKSKSSSGAVSSISNPSRIGPPSAPKCGRPAPASGHPVYGSDHEDSNKPGADWREKLKTYLEKEGLRSSEQRDQIAALILSLGVHLSAQEIVDRVRKTHPGIGAATVYRNIKVLCDALILKESLNDAEGRTVYEPYDEDHHDHIVCLDCGQIFEFHEEGIEKLQDRVTQQLQFEPVRHRHVIYAHCTYNKKSGSSARTRK